MGRRKRLQGLVSGAGIKQGQALGFVDGLEHTAWPGPASALGSGPEGPVDAFALPRVARSNPEAAEGFARLVINPATGATAGSTHLCYERLPGYH